MKNKNKKTIAVIIAGVSIIAFCLVFIVPKNAAKANELKQTVANESPSNNSGMISGNIYSVDF